VAYLISHWRGAQGLAWSFWVNLVAVRVALLLLQDGLLEDGPSSLVDATLAPRAIAVIGLTVFTHGIVLAWQLVGVIRACERHVTDLGSMANVWGAQFGMIVVTLHTAVQVLGAWQSIAPAQDHAGEHRRMLDERASRYRLESLADGRRMRLSGTLELGITVALRAHLERYPGTRTVVLDSPGGNVHEARGLARVIRDNALDTLVTGNCSSACTIAFIGGTRRFLARDARLGFHRYRIDADYPALLSDPEAAQRRDRELYASAGVGTDFIERMFDTAATGLWMLSPRELKEAGVVTEIVDRALAGPARPHESPTVQ